MSRYSKYAALLVMVAIAVLLWSTRLADKGKRGEPSESLMLVAPHGLEGIVDADVGEATSASTSNSNSVSADVADHREKVAPSNNESGAQNREEDSDEEPSVTEHVNSILKSRDLSQALVVYRSLQQCSFAPITDEELQHQLAEIQQMRNDPEHGWELAEHLVGAEERKLALRDQCRELVKLRERIWATELFDRAVNGDEFARFLYAMWAPRSATALRMKTEDLMAYESMALEFTRQNLDEGHPLGLLAFGFSYQHAQLFTPRRFFLGNAYLIAAELCSNGEFGLQAMLDSTFEYFEQGPYGTGGISAQDILENGARLYEAHCATSISNSPP